MRRPMLAALALLMTMPAAAQDRRGDRWVATWATALVARPPVVAGRGQGPGGPPAPNGPAPAVPAGAPGATPPAGAPAAPPGGRGGFAPPTNVNNQTIRQIVHTSIGGSRVRVVLSNAFGTAPIEIGAGSVAMRDATSS